MRTLAESKDSLSRNGSTSLDDCSEIQSGLMSTLSSRLSRVSIQGFSKISTNRSCLLALPSSFRLSFACKSTPTLSLVDLVSLRSSSFSSHIPPFIPVPQPSACGLPSKRASNRSHVCEWLQLCSRSGKNCKRNQQHRTSENREQDADTDEEKASPSTTSASRISVRHL